MSTITCPACGVAVVDGYVKCPKCGARMVQRRNRSTLAGGTTLEQESSAFPVMPVLGLVVVVGAVIAFALLRGGDDPPAQAAPAPAPAQAAEPTAAAPTTPDPDDLPGLAPTVAGRPDPSIAAGDLERELRRARLWGTVEATSPRVDVRSGACADPGMAPVLDAAAPAMRQAGLTRLRCLEQSGRVVFERDL